MPVGILVAFFPVCPASPCPKPNVKECSIQQCTSTIIILTILTISIIISITIMRGGALQRNETAALWCAPAAT